MGKSKDKRKSAGDSPTNGDGGDDSVLEANNVDEKVSWEEKIKYLNPISRPLASKKLTKKLYKTIRKASQCNSVKKGIKEVQKSIRKGEKGIVILAGDVTPLDIMSHLPVLCEENGLQYCYIPSKKELGESLGSKRQSCMVLIKKHDSFSSEYAECKSKIDEIAEEY